MFTLDPPARVSVKPYHSVSLFEDGLERIMQAVAVEIILPVRTDEGAIMLSMQTNEISA